MPVLVSTMTYDACGLTLDTSLWYIVAMNTKTRPGRADQTHDPHYSIRIPPEDREEMALLAAHFRWKESEAWREAGRRFRRDHRDLIDLLRKVNEKEA